MRKPLQHATIIASTQFMIPDDLKFGVNFPKRRAALKAMGVKLLFVFGSVARGRTHAESDIDVGVLFDRRVSSRRYGTLQVRILNMLCDILHANNLEVVILNSAPPLLQYVVTREGIRVFGNDEDSSSFSLFALKNYEYHKPLFALNQHYFSERVRLGYITKDSDVHFLQRVRPFHSKNIYVTNTSRNR